MSWGIPYSLVSLCLDFLINKMGPRVMLNAQEWVRLSEIITQLYTRGSLRAWTLCVVNGQGLAEEWPSSSSRTVHGPGSIKFTEDGLVGLLLSALCPQICIEAERTLFSLHCSVQGWGNPALLNPTTTLPSYLAVTTQMVTIVQPLAL